MTQNLYQKLVLTVNAVTVNNGIVTELGALDNLGNTVWREPATVVRALYRAGARFVATPPMGTAVEMVPDQFDPEPNGEPRLRTVSDRPLRRVLFDLVRFPA